MKVVDFEAERSEMLAAVARGREILARVLGAHNGTFAPEMYCFGHSHIDVAWLWPLQETYHKCERTFATQLELMKEYPEYKFLQSQAYLYEHVARLYPELYERIKQAAADGQWIPDGALYVEPDTNLAGGEALIRQFMYGKRFFKDEFGVDSRLCWLPDVFGYSGAFPQIMKGCGVDAFSTQKLLWSYGVESRFPHNTFHWQGIDGTRVMAHIHFDYNAHTNPAALIGRWEERHQTTGIDGRMFPFGYGDGGDGPTRDHLEYLRRMKDLQGVPRTRIVPPIEFFDDLKARDAFPDAEYVGELYFEAHRGTYTSQAHTKRGNRRSEWWLRETEMWGALAGALKGHPFTAADTAQEWKTVLLNQFHDIIPGSSIHRVYEEAEEAYNAVLCALENKTMAAVGALVDKGDALTVFNSLSFADEKLVRLPFGWWSAADAQGTELKVQDGFVKVKVPACGWTTIYRLMMLPEEEEIKPEDLVLENELVRAEFSEKGELISFVDKETGKETLSAPGNVMKMFRDVPGSYDAWDLDSDYKDMPVALDGEVYVEMGSCGPLFSSLLVRRSVNNSLMLQRIILPKGSRRLDFETVVNWQEKHKILKVAFPAAVHATTASHEIQFGYIDRPTHHSSMEDEVKFEVCNHRWTAVADASHGAAVLNDCKYGINVEGSTMNLTLLKSAVAPDMTADLGEQRFTYSYYPFDGSLQESGVVQQGMRLNAPLVTAPGDGGTFSAFELESDAKVFIDTVKPAEDGSGDIVLRIYEAMNTSGSVVLKSGLNIKGAEATDMLEEGGQPLSVDGGCIKFDVRPFEIKTIRIKL